MANLSKPQFSQEFANHEIAVVALFLLGGRSGSIETEDVAVQMNILAPGRFNWRKYKDQIDIDNIRSSLRDAKKKRNGALVSGSEKEGWRLTQSGLAFLEASGEHLDIANLSRERMGRQEIAWARRERNRLLHEPAFVKIKDQQIDEISQQDVERFFRIDDYVQGDARRQRLQRVVNLFADDPDLGFAVRTLAERLTTG
jgi:hypothetical protein